VVYSGQKWIKVGDFMLMGEYHHTIDEKGRLTIPSKIRYELGEGFVNIIRKYKELPQTKDVRNFMRIFLSGATTLEFDKQGRINIPSPLVAFANLKKDCIIIGVNDRLEVWSNENWQEFINTNEDNLSDIADNLFASNFNI